jgi:hypothetical protein
LIVSATRSPPGRSFRVGDHVGVGIHPARLDPSFAEKDEHLAPATAEVEHGRVAPEVLDVGHLTGAHGFRGAAHTRLERKVVGNRISGRLRCDGLRPRQGRSFGSRSPLESGQALLQLGRHSSCGLACRLAPIVRLVEVVDQLEHGVVEGALLGRERLDVPAQERTEQTLDAVGDESSEAAPARYRSLCRHAPGSLRLAPPDDTGGARRIAVRAACAAPPDLVGETGEKLVDVHILLWRNSARSRTFMRLAAHRRIITRGCYGNVMSPARE